MKSNPNRFDAVRPISFSKVVLVCQVLSWCVFLSIVSDASAQPKPETAVDLKTQADVVYFAGKLESDNRLSVIGAPDVPWKPMAALKYKDLVDTKEICYRMPIPAIDTEHPALFIGPGYIDGLELYMDDQHIYRFHGGSDLPLSDHQTRRFGPHLIPLAGTRYDPNANQTFLYVRYLYTSFAIDGLLNNIYAGSMQSVIALMKQQMIYYKFIKSSMGAIFLFVGCVSLGIFIARARSRDYPLLSFGCFLICAGLHYMYLRIAYTFELSTTTAFYLNYFSTTLSPAGIMAFLGQMILMPWRRIFRILWPIHILFILVFAVAIRLYLPAVKIFSTIFNSLLAIYLCIGMVVLYKARTQYRSRLLLLAFLIFFSFVFTDDLLWLILSRKVYSEHCYGIGVIVLICAFGYTLFDHYKSTLKRSQDYRLELEINERKMLQLERENLQARFDALKNQLNPHFLFNTFGTLISLIEKNRSDAVQFVEELSRIYRHLLLTQDRKLVSLRSELEFTAAYSYLVAKRFGGKVTISVSVAECYLDYYVPPLSLQLLIENAIKHNVISHKSPLEIALEAQSDNYLAVKNNYQKKSVLEKPTKLGLKNLKHRYRFFTKRKVEVISDDRWYLVRIPILAQPLEAMG